MKNFLLILIALGLVLLNAFFVAAEFGMVKLRHTRVSAIKDQYGIRGAILEKIHKQLDAYLSACQLGITLASLGLGWIGEPAVARVLARLFGASPFISRNASLVISFFLAFSILSFLHIVIGELMPKSLAIRQSERVSLWTAFPLYGFYWLMYPAIWLLNKCSNFFLKVIGLSETHKGERSYSPDEIKLILAASHLHGELSKEEIDILEHTLDLADLKTIDIMRPIIEMVYIKLDQPIEKLIRIMLTHRYSRYPVFDPDAQDFIGIIHVKDLIPAFYPEKTMLDVKSLIRPIPKISAHAPALDALNQFRRGAPHFAIIYNEVDEAIGFVTLDNLLYVIVGRIKDEFHKTENDWTLTKEGAIVMKGNSSIYALERALDIELPTTEAHTLTGLILSQLGTLPKENEKIEFDNFTVMVTKMEGARIMEVTIFSKKKKSLHD